MFSNLCHISDSSITINTVKNLISNDKRFISSIDFLIFRFFSSFDSFFLFLNCFFFLNQRLGQLLRGFFYLYYCFFKLVSGFLLLFCCGFYLFCSYTFYSYSLDYNGFSILLFFNTFFQICYSFLYFFFISPLFH